MILWRNIENYPFLSFDSDPRFPPFLLYVRWKAGVTFVRRCFRDAQSTYNTTFTEGVSLVVLLQRFTYEGDPVSNANTSITL